MHRLGLVAILLLVSACTTTASLDTLRTTQLTGSPFQIALARHYLDFSEQEVALYDWWSSKYFADKGLMVAYGQDVPPEQLANWEIASNARGELKAARVVLMEVLTPQLKAQRPELAASVQFAFDIWLEEQEEGWDTQRIDRLRKRFYELIEQAQQPPEPAMPQTTLPQVGDVAADPPDMPGADARPEAPAAPALSSSYLIHFPWDASSVAGVARDELEAMAVSLKANPETNVIIHGHADRSGTDEYNMELSQQRADFIRRFLAAHGIAEDRITYYAFGESDPKVPTPDGVREPENRRVEIYIE